MGSVVFLLSAGVGLIQAAAQAGGDSKAMVATTGPTSRATPGEPMEQGIARRKRAYLQMLADRWREAGYPIAWKHEEWKFDEIEPNFDGALAAMVLKRSREELARADAFFAAMPLDERCDPDMRVCQALHAYYLFREDPDLSASARRRLLEIIRFKPAPCRIYPSVWDFHATENHAFMGHVWYLLGAQIADDAGAQRRMGRHIEAFIDEHIRKGWLEYNSPCYVEKEIGCLVLLYEWAREPGLRRKAGMALDVLFAEHAVLSLEGMLGGAMCRVYGEPAVLPLNELNHNSRRDAACAGSYPCMWMLFGTGAPHDYGVLGAPLLATSRYRPPRAVYALATAGEARGCYAFQARRAGSNHSARFHHRNLAAPPPEVFNARVYAWVTPEFVLGSFQEVAGRYEAVRAAPLSCVLRMAGSTRRVIYTDLIFADRKKNTDARVDCVQHKNVAIGRGIVGRAYLAVDEFDEVRERDGWIFIRAGGTYAAYRVADGGYRWQHVKSPGVYGDFIRFDKPDAPFVLEASRAADYGRDFDRFQADILDNRLDVRPDGVTYESSSSGTAGPSAERFVVSLRYGKLPLVNGKPLDLESYPTFASPYLNSAWDSGRVVFEYAHQRMTIDLTRPGRLDVRR